MRVLMCPPEHYRIEYEINPWMNRSRQSDHELAQRQWQNLYRLLRERLAVDVSLIAPKRGLPDMVFTANAGFVWQQKLILSNVRHAVRRGESIHFEDWFAAKQYEIVRLPAQDHFEGEGDLLMCGEVLFAGYPIRSSLNSHRLAAEITRRKVVSLKLIDEWFYHLDTCFCPLSAGAAIYYPAAFESEAVNLLKKHIPTLIAVDDEEARRFACNAVVVAKNVVMNDGCPDVRRRLEALGYAVFEVALSEFIKSGGSAKCLVLKMPHVDSED